MTSGQKVAVSLLLTIFLFAGFVVLAFSGFFSMIETRFYQPAQVKAIEANLASISVAFTEFIDQKISIFEEYAKNDAIKTSSNPTQTSEHIAKRAELFSETTNKIPGFLGLRVLDTNGKHIHYSSFDSDVLKQQSNAISYKNYDSELNLPYENFVLSNLILDESKNQFIFSFPYINNYDTEQGRVLFYVSTNDFNRFLISKNLIGVNQQTSLVTKPDTNKTSVGFIFGYPVTNYNFFKTAIFEKWNQGLYTPQTILDTEDGKWIMISDSSSPLITVAIVEKESYFVFSDTVKILLLACIFLSIFLIFFLLFNLKQDSMVVIKHKIKKFQLAFINQYLDKENVSNWGKLKSEIDKRRNDLSLEVKKSLGLRGKRHSKEIDSFLSKSWEDILVVLSKNTPKNQVAPVTNVNMDEIKSMLEQLLSNGAIKVQTVHKEVQSKQNSQPIKVQELDEVEEIAEIEELDEVEEVSEIEELDEVEEIAEIEELDEVEEVSEIEELDEVEEVSEIEELDEVEEIAEIEELDEVEEVSEIEELDEVEEIAEIEEIDEVEEVSEIEEIDEVEEVSEIEEIDEVEEVSEIEELDEVEEVSEIEELDEIEEVSEIEELAEIEEVSEIEEIAEIEETQEEDEILQLAETKEKEDADTSFMTEPLIFSDVSVKKQTILDGAADSFKVYDLDYSFLDEKEEEAPEEIEELAPAEELKPINKTPSYFSFTNYAAISSVGELTPDVSETKQPVSIEELNGVFHIKHNIDTSLVKQDISFKELVESVLKYE